MILLLAALLREHPNPDEVTLRHWLASSVCRCTGYQVIIDAALVAARRAKESDLSMLTLNKLSVVGDRVIAQDGIVKVRGTAIYTFDRTLPNMLHAKVLRSPHAHARIREIHSGRAALRCQAFMWCHGRGSATG